MRARELRPAPPSAPWQVDFGAETSAGSKLLHNDRNKLRRRPRFRPDISARWPRVCKDADTPSIDEQPGEILLFAVIQAKRPCKSRSASSCLALEQTLKLPTHGLHLQSQVRAVGFPARVCFMRGCGLCSLPARLWTPSSSADTTRCALGADQTSIDG